MVRFKTDIMISHRWDTNDKVPIIKMTFKKGITVFAI